MITTTKNLENLSKEELIEEVKRLQKTSNFSSTPMSIFGSNDPEFQKKQEDFLKQREKLLNGVYEIYAIKQDPSYGKEYAQYPEHPFSKTTYTHLKGDPIPENIKNRIVELIGDESEVFRSYCGMDYDGGCIYLCREDGVCNHFRPARLARIKKETLPPLTEEFIIRLHKYYSHLWRVDGTWYRADGTSGLVQHPTLEEVKERYGLQ